MSTPLIDAELNEPDGDFQSHCSEFEGPILIFQTLFFFSVLFFEARGRAPITATLWHIVKKHDFLGPLLKKLRR